MCGVSRFALYNVLWTRRVRTTWPSYSRRWSGSMMLASFDSGARVRAAATRITGRSSILLHLSGHGRLDRKPRGDQAEPQRGRVGATTQRARGSPQPGLERRIGHLLGQRQSGPQRESA
jgi:hypothetical protein